MLPRRFGAALTSDGLGARAARIAIAAGLVIGLGACCCGGGSGVKGSDPSPSATPFASAPGPAQRAPVAPSDNGPPEPPPPSAASASEVPALEDQLAKDKALAGIWTPARRADLNVLLTGISDLLDSTTPSGTAHVAVHVMEVLKTKQLDASTKTLWVIFLETNQFPSWFMTDLRAHLDATHAEPNLGVWSAKKTDAHDYSALAAWLTRKGDYIRAMLAARKGGHLDWPTEPDVIRPWLATEKGALLALRSLDTLTSQEASRLADLKASKYGDVQPLRVAIGTLLSEYKQNEVRADAAYKGKAVQLTGTVGDVKKDITDTIYVTLGTGAAFELPVVQCFFDDRLARKAALLNKGDTVTVRGMVSGLMMNVLVQNCEFAD